VAPNGNLLPLICLVRLGSTANSNPQAADFNLQTFECDYFLDGVVDSQVSKVVFATFCPEDLPLYVLPLCHFVSDPIPLNVQNRQAK